MSSSLRPLTFLIADVRGYTRFTRERGDAAAAILAKRFADLCRDAVAARGGRVIELRGDEALAIFERPANAVLAALDFQATCMEESAADPAFPLPVGIGIDVGDAVPVEDGYRGVALNMAARLCSSAGAGQVLVTRAIADGAELDSDETTFLERGPASFKGFEEPIDVIEAIAPPRDSVAAFDADGDGDGDIPPELERRTPLVDRENEMRWLRGAWRTARRGAGRVLIVTGPAQIGKTRLVGELAAAIAEEGGRIRVAAPGGTGTALALSALADAATAIRPTLIVLDDVDVLGPEVARRLADVFGEVTHRPVLVVASAREATEHELALVAERTDRRGDSHRALAPLDSDGVRGIVALYAGDDVAGAPVEAIVRSSGGVPGRVHEVASDWARDEAARRLGAAAEFLAAGRRRHASDLAFANNVIELKLGQLYTVGDTGVDVGRESCPYKGLAAFEEDDAFTFFGRERLVGELAARTVQAGLLGVVGASGSGKSSVVAAGLVPSLRAGLLPGSDRWRHATIRPGEHPLAVLEEATEDRGGDGRLVVVVDQFEETFTLCASDEERARFLEALSDLAARPDDACVVLTVRSDYYGEVAPYAEIAEALRSNHVLLPPLSPEELRRVVELPARRSGLRIEQALTDTLVEEVSEEPGGLPLLSTALVELWQARDGGWIRFEAYERTGGVRGAVARLAEASYAQLSEVERDAARRVVLRLAGEGDRDNVTRRRVELDEFDLERDRAVDSVIRRFAVDRLLTVGDGTVEVAHEALLREWPRVRAWLDEDAQGREVRRRITFSARAWAASDREPSELYRGARLSAALDWAATHVEELNALEGEFLDAGRHALEEETERQRRANRRLRASLVGVAIFLAVALVAGGLALVQRGNARDSADRAERSATVALSQSLGAQAVAEPRLDTALLLARAATSVDDSVRTRSNLLTTLLEAPTVERVVHATTHRVNALAVSPGGAWIAVADNAGNVIVDDAATGALVGRMTSPSPDITALDTGIVRPIVEGEITVGYETVDPITGDVAATFHLPADAVALQREILAAVPDAEPRSGYAYDAAHDRLAIAIVIDRVPEPAPRPPGFVVQWDASTGEPFGRPIEIPEAGLLRPHYVRHGREITVVASSTMTFDATTGERIAEIEFAGDFSTAVSPDGSVAVAGHEDGSVDFVDLRSGKVTVGTGSHAAGVTALDFTSDGTTLVSSSDDGTTFVWDVASQSVRERLAGHAGSVHSQALTPDGTTLYTGGFDTTVLAYDLTGRRAFVQRFHAADTDVGFFAFTIAVSPDGRSIAVGSTDGSVHIWDLDTIEETASFDAVPGVVASLAYTSEGGLLVAGSAPDFSESWLRLFDVSGDARVVRSFDVGLAPITWTAVSDDGRFVAISGREPEQDPDVAGAVQIWELATRDRVGRTIVVDGGAPVHINFDPTGDHLAAAGYNGLVAVIDVGNGSVARRWRTQAQLTDAVAFSPDGKTLATADFGGLVRLWKWDAGASDAPPEIAPALHVSEDSADSVAWSDDGTMLVTTGGATLRLYDVKSRRQIGSSVPVSPLYPYAVLMPDQNKVVAADAAGDVWVVPVSSDLWERRACQVANRDLTRDEWRSYASLDAPYRPICA